MFEYNLTVEKLKGVIKLNYEKTRFKNETQYLELTLKGSNKALNF